MTKTFLVLGAAAVALSAAPAQADRGHHYGRATACAKWRHGHCVRWANRGYKQYRVGYVFGPRYAYTDYGALPRPYVTRYHLSRDYRYVYSGDRIYVVDPTTYAVTRVLNSISH
jgi:hypothetical protein